MPSATLQLEEASNKIPVAHI